MPRTPLGHYQRTSNGRFLYGRPLNHRLAPCMTGLPDPTNVTLDTNAGDAPLTVTATMGSVTGALTAGIRSAWPAQASGVGGTATPTGGGYAIAQYGVPRVAGASTIPIFFEVSPEGDDSFSSVLPEQDDEHIYTDAGTYTYQAKMTDGLRRESAVGDVDTVTVAVP